MQLYHKKFWRTPFLDANIRETGSAFLFKLFWMDILMLFWRVPDLAQGQAFLFAQKQSLDVFYEKRYSQFFFKNHRKTSVLQFLYDKVAGLKTCIFIKKTLQQKCFPVNIAKFLKAPILKNICERLLLLKNRA